MGEMYLKQLPFLNPSEWPQWKRRFERFLIVSGLSPKCSVEQVYALVYVMDDKAEDILASLKMTDEQKNGYNDVLNAFENHFVVCKNVVYDRATFFRRQQQEGEGVEEFVTALHRLAKLCSFGELHDEMIRDRIVVGIRDPKLSEIMQLDAELTLEKATTMARV
ncbi:hypothetical protein HPB50_029063 [Hyalomma asiaticum]|nr:hypothetical protein HPB50_029063 [Hyalomma asiaticum]